MLCIASVPTWTKSLSGTWHDLKSGSGSSTACLIAPNPEFARVEVILTLPNPCNTLPTWLSYSRTRKSSTSSNLVNSLILE
ncbi:hypothetical protein VTN77DRAFT_5760 [Rasamsonia byssochlamydoides]|uniref:uncharacterized protein n=1 Tax=Rasamsonia byssochlamydoides TaxID=89139 RepID=UPI003742E27A